MFPQNRLRIVRAERRISQLRLALAARIHPTRFWRIENCLVEPTEAERAVILKNIRRRSGPSVADTLV